MSEFWKLIRLGGGPMNEWWRIQRDRSPEFRAARFFAIASGRQQSAVSLRPNQKSFRPVRCAAYPKLLSTNWQVFPRGLVLFRVATEILSLRCMQEARC